LFSAGARSWLAHAP